jgi:hypothetical protein
MLLFFDAALNGNDVKLKEQKEEQKPLITESM